MRRRQGLSPAARHIFGRARRRRRGPTSGPRGRESRPDPKNAKMETLETFAPGPLSGIRQKPGTDRAAHPAEAVCILHDVIAACGGVKNGRIRSGRAPSGAGVPETGGGKGGWEGVGVLVRPLGRSGPIVGHAREGGTARESHPRAPPSSSGLTRGSDRPVPGQGSFIHPRRAVPEAQPDPASDPRVKPEDDGVEGGTRRRPEAPNADAAKVRYGGQADVKTAAEAPAFLACVAWPHRRAHAGSAEEAVNGRLPLTNSSSDCDPLLPVSFAERRP
jgi:hypothetical protein